MPSGERGYLVDNSAYRRRNKQVVADRLLPLLDRGLIYTCTAIELEDGRAVSGSDYERAMQLRADALIEVTIPDDVWVRAAALQTELALRSQNQGPSVVDLIIAVVADHHGLTVLHYDSDFDTIAAATGISCEWVAQPGSADGPDEL